MNDELIKIDYNRLQKLIYVSQGIQKANYTYLDRYTENVKKQAKQEVFDDIDKLIFVVKQDGDNPLDCGETCFDYDDFEELKKKHDVK